MLKEEAVSLNWWLISFDPGCHFCLALRSISGGLQPPGCISGGPHLAGGQHVRRCQADKEGCSLHVFFSSFLSTLPPEVISFHPNGLLHFSEVGQGNRSHCRYYRQ